jgi:hypothetical protein
MISDSSKSYKPYISYYLLLLIIGSVTFSIYSFIKVVLNPIFIIISNDHDIKYYHAALIINVLTITSTCKYIFIILSTICNLFTYNTSLSLVKILHYNYVITNLISFISFVSHFGSFNFFKQYYNYYYISIIIQFSVCLAVIIGGLLKCCCRSSKNHYSEVDDNYKCVCCYECTDCCINCFMDDNDEKKPLSV